ncbi:CerR family C-terminal domain-containing protein [Shinella zoogloeoides]|jgi:AcrR family transcriptional regulator|uniref:CerR family C-terminal domain-containing protein n=1 Tax=Shinella zoogloeoides TaxID=352475 RepID=A0A6N8TBB1_SHIZO|nr:CerR family C-terminal domain-containing protein [Shinella zoogloeoides]MXO00527.1 CerR family C-terminal domain-containing protein [Shinella zoogloeoides]UEX83562.1 CerR family C-terminal domain-containing protein [Shinella zoogloeoides]
MQENEHPTRAALVQVALRLFGRDGFAATSTRAIAAEAETNISSIAYHFGGKDGLRLACADFVASRIGQIARVLPADPARLTPAVAHHILKRLLRRMVLFLTAPAAEPLVAFLLRELAQPTSPVPERLYRTLIENRHRALCHIWSIATGKPAESEDVKLAVFSLVGQAAYFRLAAPVVQRRMDWNGYPPAATRAIARRLLFNLDAILEAENG